MTFLNFTKINLPKLEQKEFTFQCPKHGEQTGLIVKKPSGEWTKPFCRVCNEEKRVIDEKQKIRFDRFNQAALSMKNLLSLSYMNNEEQKFLFSTYNTVSEGQEKAKKATSLFAKNISERFDSGKNKGLGLLFVGTCGTGKTHLANAILSEVKLSIGGGYIIRAIDLFDLLRNLNTPKQQAIDLLASQSVLVIDEIGLQSWTDFERDRLQQIIDGRTANDLPTVLISNLDISELTKCLGDRLMSRVLMTCYPIVFNWKDFRKKEHLERKDPCELF